MTTLNEFRDHFDLIGYAKERFSSYVKSGANILVVCPYHADTAPSLLVDPKRAYCFACQKSVEAIDLVAHIEGRTREEVLGSGRHGGYISSTPIPKPPRTDYERPDEGYVTLGQRALRAGHNKRALAYLSDRGISDASITYWKLGYMRVPMSKFKYPRFSFPCYDEENRLISIIYRADPRYETSNRSKYVIHPRTPATIFGVHKLPSYRAFLYSGGQIDAILLNQNGFPALGVSGEGTWKIEWARLLKRHQIYLMLDNDDAGIKATARLLDLVPNSIPLEWPEGTEGYDAADLLNDPDYGKDAVNWMLANVGTNKKELRGF